MEKQEDRTRKRKVMREGIKFVFHVVEHEHTRVFNQLIAPLSFPCTPY